MISSVANESSEVHFRVPNTRGCACYLVVAGCGENTVWAIPVPGPTGTLSPRATPGRHPAAPARLAGAPRTGWSSAAGGEILGVGTASSGASLLVAPRGGVRLQRGRACGFPLVILSGFAAAGNFWKQCVSFPSAHGPSSSTFRQRARSDSAPGRASGPSLPLSPGWPWSLQAAPPAPRACTQWDQLPNSAYPSHPQAHAAPGGHSATPAKRARQGPLRPGSLMLLQTSLHLRPWPGVRRPSGPAWGAGSSGRPPCTQRPERQGSQLVPSQKVNTSSRSLGEKARTADTLSPATSALCRLAPVGRETGCLQGLGTGIRAEVAGETPGQGARGLCTR